MPDRRIIQTGAEAVLYLDNDGTLVKERVKKGYRIPGLDEEIRRQRTRRETALLERAGRAGVAVPNADNSGRYIIRMDYIRGRKLKDELNGMKQPEQDRIAGLIGAAAAKLHSANIIHGDMTTSNMIMKGGELHMIDFGLGKVSDRVEDKATDLFLLREALLSTHFLISDRMWRIILDAYAKKFPGHEEVMKRLERIEKRRRYMSH